MIQAVRYFRKSNSVSKSIHVYADVVNIMHVPLLIKSDLPQCYHMVILRWIMCKKIKFVNMPGCKLTWLRAYLPQHPLLNWLNGCRAEVERCAMITGCQKIKAAICIFCSPSLELFEWLEGRGLEVYKDNIMSDSKSCCSILFPVWCWDLEVCNDNTV